MLYVCLVILSWFKVFLELPVLEYCSPVWMSAAAFHLGLLDRVVSKALRLSNGVVVYYLEHRRFVTDFCMFYKILRNPIQALESSIASKSCTYEADLPDCLNPS